MEERKYNGTFQIYQEKKLNSTNLPTYINYNVFENVKDPPHTHKLNVQISFPYAGAISLIC